MLKSGGRIVVEALRANRIDHVFSVPGESFLPILDALVDAPDIRLTIARQEGGAAMMAEAFGKLTGRPGIALVTRGPGAANAYAGVHVAAQDSVPMILLVGLIERGFVEREAFQEIDVKAMFGDQVKWAATVSDTARLPEYLARAVSTSMSGRPGPVVLGLPEDVLSGEAEAAPVPEAVVGRPAPSRAQMARFGERLAAARRPLMIVGGETWTADDCAALVGLSGRWSLPVAAAFRCQDRFPNDHPNYAGVAGLGIDPRLAARIGESDLIVALGARLGDCTTSSYTLIDIPGPAQGLIHIHADAEELGRVYHGAMAINATVGEFLAAATRLAAPAQCAWVDWTRAANADYRAFSDTATALPGAFNLGEAVVWLRDRLPQDAIITNGAGNYSVWLHRFHRHRRYRTQLAPTSGSMGYGLPAAVAAKLVHPDRTVVCFAGDGCLQMTMQELGTIAEHQLKIIVIVVNNGMYATIRMHQEAHYPGRVSGTDLFNPDFMALAGAYGLHGERVARTADFAPAFERAMATETAALIEVLPDPRVLTPGKVMGRDA
ncbi:MULTISPECIES: thiamine pyrophosphate-binding protein [unclassified Roseitalea]|uniref:thiamine pyrophosphate-binding protein n=1 Tax=unclassified Roseitalea TaxID=2639107 RepID=UPI00273E90A1|nr:MULTISPECIES: thiamine pyrophosphate-binding protein [unclassified Roseitalea]